MYSSFKLPIQAKRLYNRYQRRYHLFQFLKGSLLDLEVQLNHLVNSSKKLETSLGQVHKIKANTSNLNSKLHILYGNASLLINDILTSDKSIEAVFVNRDYTPYSLRRDRLISRICNSKKVKFIQSGDYLLNEPESILNSEDRPFKVFFQYYKRASQIPLKKVNNPNIRIYNKIHDSLDSENNIMDADKHKRIKDLDKFFVSIIGDHQDYNDGNINLTGGRDTFAKLVLNLNYRLRNYKEEKNIVEKKQTSYLSAYLKFGICSIREAFFIIQNELGDTHPLLRQLYWRDFFTYIGFYFPHVFIQPFLEKYRNEPIQWKNDSNQFEKWCNGKTGFPIVDAGMRELNKTGYMHNRVRLITASFLVKDLHIDWRYGERYFALKLVDYDPCVNNGNWQWVSSTGCDAQPYFRTFNPWIQQEKIDPETHYIKEWIPELELVPKNIIHHWYKGEQNEQDEYGYFQNRNNNGNFTELPRYPKPIVDHHAEILVARQLYRRLAAK